MNEEVKVTDKFQHIIFCHLVSYILEIVGVNKKISTFRAPENGIHGRP
jgi:hypothetical protein